MLIRQMYDSMETELGGSNKATFLILGTSFLHPGFLIMNFMMYVPSLLIVAEYGPFVQRMLLPLLAILCIYQLTKQFAPEFLKTYKALDTFGQTIFHMTVWFVLKPLKFYAYLLDFVLLEVPHFIFVTGPRMIFSKH